MTQFEVTTLEQSLYAIEQLATIAHPLTDAEDRRMISEIRNRIQHVLVNDANKKLKKVLTDRINKKV